MRTAFGAMWAWLADYVRSLYPFMVCFVGGLVLMAHNEIGGLAALVIAGLCIAWGIDLAETKAAAKARSTAAAELAAVLMGGQDTTITVDINHNSPSA